MTKLRDGLQPLLGAKTANALAKSLDLHTVGDLLRHYPRRYTERGQLTDIAGLELGEHATVMAKIVSANKRQMRNRKGSILEIVITDGSKQITCAFFNQRWREKELLPGRSGLFAGKVNAFRGKLQLATPEYQLDGADDDVSAVDDFVGTIIPVYPAAQGLPSWVIARCIRQVLDTLDVEEDPLPLDMRRRFDLPELHTALTNIHRPGTWAARDAARARLKWDEALSVQLIFALRRSAVSAQPAIAFPRKDDGIVAEFDKRLPFELTNGQREIGERIAEDLSVPHPMNRLLQGEVGSGKTVVALRAMLQVVDSGRQAALLAPTEVLAAQHARSLTAMLGDLAMAGQLGAAEQATRVVLLTGSMSVKERRQALLDTASGAAGIVVGTHALIQKTVSFAELGMVVVDEQHRFGVEQRDALRGQGAGDTSPHVLVMTATPIPRTVAMTVYGDLEVSALREMPVGRSPIATSVVPVAEKPAWLDRAWRRVLEEVAAGHQAYVVCPRIGDEPPADGDRRPAVSVLELAEELRAGALREVEVGVLHGRLPADEKDAVMRKFAAGDIDVLIATTVVEVGVDVPNASAMVIMDADWFGMSQLHQLRGRVGRGEVPGVCLLVTEMPAGTTSRDRLAAIESTTDGFELSKQDMEFRREGDILGAQQSGNRSSLKLLSLLRDEDLIARTRDVATEIIRDDPALAAHPGLAGMLDEVVGADRAEYLEKS